jgi:hypothetical protein
LFAQYVERLSNEGEILSEEPWSVILEGRQILTSGGTLFSKGSNKVPSRLRKCFLDRIDKSIPITFESRAAREPGAKTHIEHMVPMKRVAIEIIDPSGHDPRTVDGGAEGLGPARNLEHAEEIARKLIVKAFVTEDEHKQLNRSGRSQQWDTAKGDPMKRYRDCGITLVRCLDQ